MNRFLSLLALAGLSLSLTSCGLVQSVGRVGAGLLKMPANALGLGDAETIDQNTSPEPGNPAKAVPGDEGAVAPLVIE